MNGVTTSPAVGTAALHDNKDASAAEGDGVEDLVGLWSG